MENKTDSESLNKKIFSIINWLDFSLNQKFFYKKTELTDAYLFLFSSFLFYIVGNQQNSIDGAVKDYLYKTVAAVLNKYPQLDEVTCAKRIKKHFLFGNKTDFRYLLVSQIWYTVNLTGISAGDDFKNILREKLLFKEEEFSVALNYANNPQFIKDKMVAQSFSAYLDFVKNLASYNSLTIANIGVCATMSAGKSSFVNALLGYDYLPVRNEATTARVTSVYDNDHSEKLIGFTMNGDKVIRIEDNLSEKDVNVWNSDANISHILLQGDFDNIGNNGIVVAVHDTPGTNNSGDKTHHKITMDFLSSHKMDAIVFVANVEQLCTTDEKALLKELYEKVTAPQNIPMIFVLNKADSIDTEKESLEDVIVDYKEFVADIGFSDAKVFPVSSKAARLLKMAIKGHGNLFTESECDAFPSIVRKFTKRLILGNSDGSVTVSGNAQVSVDGEQYESAVLQTAFIHSGINTIEKEIESIVR